MPFIAAVLFNQSSTTEGSSVLTPRATIDIGGHSVSHLASVAERKRKSNGTALGVKSTQQKLKREWMFLPTASMYGMASLFDLRYPITRLGIVYDTDTIAHNDNRALLDDFKVLCTATPMFIYLCMPLMHHATRRSHGLFGPWC